MKKISILLIAILGLACNAQKNVSEKAAPKTESQLTTFGYLEEADGCSCYFARTQEAYDQKKFIYADNYGGGDAFIAIDGEQVKIDLSDTEKNTYQVKIEFTSKEQLGPESWKRTGTLQVTLPDGSTLKEAIVGTCGC